MLQRNGAPGATRTPDPLLRRQLLCPLSYRRLEMTKVPSPNDQKKSQQPLIFWHRHRSFAALTPSLARPERIELPTCWFEASRSIQLSYGRLSQ